MVGGGVFLLSSALVLVWLGAAAGGRCAGGFP